jgi:hypothetical protein
MWIRVLEKQTGKGVGHWNARIKKEKFADARSLEAWLAHLGATGYAKQLLVMERFGYPDFVTASADELIDAQYADRPHLRPIYEAIVAAARNLGEIVVQVPKRYVSLVMPRRASRSLPYSIPEAMTFPAGLSRMPFEKFLAAVLLGSVPTAFVFAAVPQPASRTGLVTWSAAATNGNSAAVSGIIIPSVWMSHSQHWPKLQINGSARRSG